MSAPARLLAHLAAFLVGSLLWMIVCGIIATLWLVFTGGSLEVAADPEALQELLGAGAMGMMTILQIGGLAALAAGLALFLPHEPGQDPRGRIADHLALRGAAWPLLVGGGLGAVTIWTFPSWVATELIELVPSYQSTLELITTMLQTGPLPGRVILAFSVVVSAPLFEELIFRGYLWRVLEQALPPAAVWIGTSLLFAGYHMDPIHVVSLLPTALFLGWLRWVSGSVWPAILAHFVNNGIATLAAVLVPPHVDGELGLLPSVLGLLFSVTIAAAGWALHRRST